MSDPPMFVKRTKSKTIQSRKPSALSSEITDSISPSSKLNNTTNETKDDDSIQIHDGDKEPKDSEEKPTIVSQFRKSSKKTNKAQSRVSFGVDDEGDSDPFTVRKSSLSKKLKTGIGASPLASPGSNLSNRLAQTSITPSQSTGPKYDASYLSELRASTNARPSALTKQDADGNIMDIDVPSNSGLIFGADELEGAIVEGMEEDMPLIPLGVAKETIIHSELTVKAAKEKRELAKKAGVSDEMDYISLTDNGVVARRGEGYQGPHPSSRLMREDDDLGEGDDDDAEFTGAKERIALSKKGRKEEEKKRKKAVVELLEEVDEEEDEESKEWELAQIRRAAPSGAMEEVKGKTKEYKPHPIPTPVPIPSLDQAVLRLSKTLTALTTSHTQSTAALAQIAEDHASFDKEEKELREQVAKSEERRAWVQELSERMENVGEFLEAKFPILEALESEHLSLFSERSQMISNRRKEDDEDDLVLLYGIPSDVMLEDAVDEMGRAVPSAADGHSAVRRERRRARAERHAASLSKFGSQMKTGMANEEGYTTDATLSPSDAQDFTTAIELLKEKVEEEVFGDVKAKAFRDPRHGIEKWFKEWREKYTESYDRAFGGMGLVQAWEFWARVEMVGWVPFDTSPQLDHFKWYHRLYQYTHGDSGEEEEVRPEDNLPSQMTSTALVPILIKLLDAGASDVWSSKCIGHVVDCCEQVELLVGSESGKFEALLTAVSRQFRKASASLLDQHARFSSSQISTFDPKSLEARKRYMRRVAKLSDCVLKWRRYTKERDGLGLVVQELIELLTRVAESGWDVGGEAMLRAVVGRVPGELVPANVKGRLGI